MSKSIVMMKRRTKNKTKSFICTLLGRIGCMLKSVAASVAGRKSWQVSYWCYICV